MWDPSFLSKDQTCSHHRGSLESATELSRKSLLICGVCSSVSKESACNAGDPGSIPESGRSPEKEMATHSSILAWKILWAEEPGRTVHEVAKSQTRLSDFTFTFIIHLTIEYLVIK